VEEAWARHNSAVAAFASVHDPEEAAAEEAAYHRNAWPADPASP